MKKGSPHDSIERIYMNSNSAKLNERKFKKQRSEETKIWIYIYSGVPEV